MNAGAAPYERWRSRALVLLQGGVPPERAAFDGAWTFETAAAVAMPAAATPTVPRRLVDLLARVACHRAPEREALMYRLLWRSLHGARGVLDDPCDIDMIGAMRMARAVDRAAHKMTAFVRFRAIDAPRGRRYGAWFEPEHDVLVRAAPHFVRRFGAMLWTIATPDGIAAWNGDELVFDPPDARVRPPAEDAAECLWLAYYAHIFNPARLNDRQMRREMPVRYWKHLPEARAIPALLATASERAGRMVETTNPCARPTPRVLRERAAGRGIGADASDGPPALHACRRCPLGESATQAIPGEGPQTAPLMLVGEQPGDEEDLAGRPFVGPAGRLLRALMVEAGVEPETAYLTNAVKHFGYELRGKRRLHKTPAQRDVEACRAHLEAEVARVRPRVVLALGATALASLARRRIAIGVARGAPMPMPGGMRLRATWHPAAVLRAVDDATRARLRAELVADLHAARFDAERGRDQFDNGTA